MKRFLKILVILVLVILVVWGIIFRVDYKRCSNFEKPIFVVEKNGKYYGLGYKVIVEKDKVEMYMFNKFIAGAIADLAVDTNKNMVIITNGKIQNEDLIDSFIENIANFKDAELDIIQDEDNILLEYISGEYKKGQDETESVGVSKDDSIEEYMRIYGYYRLTKNGEEVEKLDRSKFLVARRQEQKDVYLTFNTIGTICLESPIDICKYNLEESNYKQNFVLTYNQRKDLGLKKVANENDYSIYTYGGDVTITIENDMVYKLEDALSKVIITSEDIIKQAEVDCKYGICEKRYYSDGGSVEYGYSNYTILKYNTLNGNKDLVIGMSGQIINSIP